VIIKTGYTCNDNCVFCHAREKRKHPDLGIGKIKEKILRGRELGAGMVILSGGEPTIHKDIMEIAEFARENALELGIITNGRMLSYSDFFGRLQKKGLRYVHVSLHGDEKTHNELTGAESFRQALEGISNVSRSGMELVVNCVVVKQNMNILNDVVDVLKGVRTDKIKFSLVEPVRDGAMPGILEAADAVKKAIDYGRAAGLNMGFDGFPLCFMKGHERLLDNLETNNIKFISEAYEDRFFPVDFGDAVKLDKCKQCSRSGNCPGIYKKYLDSGNIEVFPFRG